MNTYTLSEQEYDELNNLVRDVQAYFENDNHRRDAVFSIKRIGLILHRQMPDTCPTCNRSLSNDR